MTNEELVLMIRSGRTEFIPELWEQVEKFIVWRIDKYLINMPYHYQQFKDDMKNESYIWFLKAIEKYDLNRGAFLTALGQYLKDGFRISLYGGTSEHYIKEPVNTAKSLDVLIETDDPDTLLIDMISDDNALIEFNCYEDQEYQQDLHNFLVNCILKLEDEEIQSLFLYMLQNNCTRVEAVEAVTGSRNNYRRYTNKYNKAIKQLRQHMKTSAVKKQAELIGFDESLCYKSGLSRWKENHFTSTVEEIAIKNADYFAIYEAMK